MLLKIFVKRKAMGELIVTGHEYHTWLFEGDEIYSKDLEATFTGDNVPDYKSWVGKQFMVKKNGVVIASPEFYPDSEGYEILNSEGVVIDRFVTAIN